MIAKNTGSKIVGFGKLALLPGETEALPDGYDNGHPAVRLYLARGWIAEVGAGTQELAISTDGLGVPVSDEGMPSAGVAEALVEEAADALVNEQAAREVEVEALKRMTLAQLQERASGLGIEWSASDTKAALAERIAARLKGE